MSKTADRTLVASNSPKPQGEGEEIDYSFRFKGATTAVYVSLAVYDNKNKDVTSDVTTGSGSESGNVVTVPTVKDLKAGITYRLVCTATVDGQTKVAVGDVIGVDPRKV